MFPTLQAKSDIGVGNIMLSAAPAAWDASAMADMNDLRGRALYDAFMRLKPKNLAETEWAAAAGVNRGFFTNLKNQPISPRGDTLRKLLSHVGKTETDLYRAARGEPVPDPDIPPTRSADGGEAVEIISLDLSLAMGPGTIIDDFVESEPVIFDGAQLRRITRSPFTRLRVVTGIGTSHEPKFHHSDQFLIDINDRQLTKLDGYYWITFEGAHALKRLRPLGGGRVQIISENPEYGPIDAEPDQIRIEGRAVWVARGL